jgi:protein MAK11
LEKGSLEPTVLLSTCSSDGFIRVYDLGEMVAKFGVEEVKEEAVASYDTKGSRLTCVFLADGRAKKGGVAVPEENEGSIAGDSEEEDEDEDEGDEEEDEDIYGSAGEEEVEADEMAVEFEDEEEEEGEEEDEGEEE